VFFIQMNFGSFLITHLSPDALAAFRQWSPGTFARPFKRQVFGPYPVPGARSQLVFYAVGSQRAFEFSSQESRVWNLPLIGLSDEESRLLEGVEKCPELPESFVTVPCSRTEC
jgi:hypothetical protein